MSWQGDFQHLFGKGARLVKGLWQMPNVNGRWYTLQCYGFPVRRATNRKFHVASLADFHHQ
jgi:hypothetical protein